MKDKDYAFKDYAIKDLRNKDHLDIKLKSNLYVLWKDLCKDL